MPGEMHLHMSEPTLREWPRKLQSPTDNEGEAEEEKKKGDERGGSRSRTNVRRERNSRACVDRTPEHCRRGYSHRNPHEPKGQAITKSRESQQYDEAAGCARQCRPEPCRAEAGQTGREHLCAGRPEKTM